MRAVGFYREHRVKLGVLLVTGWWDRIVQWLQLQVVQGFAVPV